MNKLIKYIKNIFKKEVKEMIIAKVWYAKANAVKMITVPKDCELKTGDYVRLEKVEQ